MAIRAALLVSNQKNYDDADGAVDTGAEWPRPSIFPY